MRVILGLLLLLGFAQSKPQIFKPIVDAARSLITKYDKTSDNSGGYTYNVASDDGQQRYETRRVINPGTDQEQSIVEGYFSYLDPNGQRKTVGYKADENGFYAEGEHLPNSANAVRKPPEVGIPPAAVSSLAGGGIGR